MASDAAKQHRADVDRITPGLADALKSHLEAQRKKKVKRVVLDSKAENAQLKAAILPHTTAAVKTGAARVASVLGKGTPSPTTTLAGAWAYKAAAQINTTTQGAVDTTDTESTGTVTHAFDVRVGAVAAMAAGIISNAINSGAFNYAKTSTTATAKTWEVTDDNPCATCSEVTGETVPSATDFSNGAPFPSIHSGCMCTVSFVAASSTSRSQRTIRMTYEEWRAQKYSADDMKDLLAKGKAMKNATGDPSYPVADKEDIEKAIHAVGRGKATHDAIRKHIIAGAKALKLTDLIPDNWNADGTVATAKSDDPDGEVRADDKKVKCPTCTGSGKILEGHRKCPDCDGTGEVEPTVATTTPAVADSAPRRAPRRQKRSLERGPEWRTFATQFERRAAQEGNDIVLSGFPIRYSAPYSVRDMLGSFRETMHRGVASSAMESRTFDCRFLVNHEGMPLARSVSGTLVLEDTPRGLRSEAHLDGRQQSAVDLAIAVERGDVSQMSCGFVVATGGDEWRFGDDGVEERDVYSFDELFDVSAVTYPASPTTSIELAQRALARAGSESRERIRRLFLIGGSARSGGPLSQKDGEDLRAVAEALYRAEEGAPLHIQLELYRSAVATMERALRAGKVLSADNQQALQDALDALHAADDIDIPGITAQLETIDKALDAGQAGLAQVLGKANPDGDKNDKNPTLVPATSKTSDADARARQRNQLEIIRTRQLLAV